MSDARTYFSFSWSRKGDSGFGACLVNTAEPRTPEEFERCLATIRDARGNGDKLVLLWWRELVPSPPAHPIEEK